MLQEVDRDTCKMLYTKVWGSRHTYATGIFEPIWGKGEEIENILHDLYPVCKWCLSGLLETCFVSCYVEKSQRGRFPPPLPLKLHFIVSGMSLWVILQGFLPRWCSGKIVWVLRFWRMFRFSWDLRGCLHCTYILAAYFQPPSSVALRSRRCEARWGVSLSKWLILAVYYRWYVFIVDDAYFWVEGAYSHGLLIIHILADCGSSIRRPIFARLFLSCVRAGLCGRRWPLRFVVL